MLEDPAFNRVCFDISWDEVAKYIVSSPEATRTTADLINRYPDRFLFGTDTVAPSGRQGVLRRLRHVPAAVEPADAGGQGGSPQGELRADLRRRAEERSRLGEGASGGDGRMTGRGPLERKEGSE